MYHTSGQVIQRIAPALAQFRFLEQQWLFKSDLKDLESFDLSIIYFFSVLSDLDAPLYDKCLESPFPSCVMKQENQRNQFSLTYFFLHLQNEGTHY